MRRTRFTLALCAVWGAFGATASGQTVWTGPPTTFTKVDFADWTLQEHQDRMTDNVWITRANAQGIFNINVEDGYTLTSPADTEWAFGSAADWENLTFQTWFDWHGGSPPSVIDVAAVVHLITDDIYLDITFLSWTSGGGGGGFSCRRSTPIPGPPALALVALAGLVPSRRRTGG